VWTFLIECDKPRNFDGMKERAIVDLNSISSFMVTHKKAKETFHSLNGWVLCANALIREEKQLGTFVREQNDLMRERRARTRTLLTRCSMEFNEAFDAVVEAFDGYIQMEELQLLIRRNNLIERTFLLRRLDDESLLISIRPLGVGHIRDRRGGLIHTACRAAVRCNGRDDSGVVRHQGSSTVGMCGSESACVSMSNTSLK
jgi:hypothetical protein